jgi:hypothetical protein
MNGINNYLATSAPAKSRTAERDSTRMMLKNTRQSFYHPLHTLETS